MIQSMAKYDAHIQRAALLKVMKDKKLTLNSWCQRAGFRESGVRGFLKDKSTDKTLNVKTIVNLADAADTDISELLPFNSVAKIAQQMDFDNNQLFDVVNNVTLDIVRHHKLSTESGIRVFVQVYNVAFKLLNTGGTPTPVNLALERQKEYGDVNENSRGGAERNSA